MTGFLRRGRAAGIEQAPLAVVFLRRRSEGLLTFARWAGLFGSRGPARSTSDHMHCCWIITIFGGIEYLDAVVLDGRR